MNTLTSFRLVSVWLGLMAAAIASLHAAPRPNIILIIGDDISFDDFGCYGATWARTPHVDRLAAGGLRFTNAFLTASSCSPSRSSIVTGRYPHNNGAAAELHRPIAGHLPWFPALLRAAGYHTGLSGKYHMTREESSPPAAAEPGPFAVVDTGIVPGNHGGHANWVKCLQERPRDQPFFFWFAALDAHRGWEGDNEWDEAVLGKRHVPQDMRVPPFLVDNEETRRDLASHANEVTRFDHYIGRVVAELERQQILEHTLIFVLADNGRPFPRAKTRLHDSGMKTALVAHWPAGIRGRGEACASLVSAIDLAPTILELAGVAIPPSVQGRSIQPTFLDAKATVRRFAFSEHNWHDYAANARAVRDGEYLYILNLMPELPWQGPADSVRSPAFVQLKAARDAGTLTAAQKDVFLSPRPREELYHSASDPDQLRNLTGAPAHRHALERLRSVMIRWREETGDCLPEEPSVDAFDRETGERRFAPRDTRYYRQPPGADRAAATVDRPGPW